MDISGDIIDDVFYGLSRTLNGEGCGALSRVTTAPSLQGRSRGRDSFTLGGGWDGGRGRPVHSLQDIPILI